jgi:uracil-DNA glycosylase family 4
MAYECAGVDLEPRLRPIRLLIIGEGPGQTEDEKGVPFCGASGQFLWRAIVARGLTDRVRLDRAFVTNRVACRPPNNRPPERDEMFACVGRIQLQVAAIRPAAVLLLGQPSASLVIGEARISACRGQVFAWKPFADVEGAPGGLRRLTVPAVPTWHPSYLMRSHAQWNAPAGVDPKLDRFLEDIARAADIAEGRIFYEEQPGTAVMSPTDLPF